MTSLWETPKLDIIANSKGHHSLVFREDLQAWLREIQLREGLIKHLLVFLQTQWDVQDTVKDKSEAIFQKTSEFYWVPDIRNELIAVIKKALTSDGKTLLDIRSVTFYSHITQLKLSDGTTLDIDLSPRTLEEMIIQKNSIEDRRALTDNLPKVMLLASGMWIVFYDVIPTTYEYYVKEIRLSVNGQEEIVKINEKFTSKDHFNRSLLSMLEDKWFRLNPTNLKLEKIVDIFQELTPNNVLSVINAYTYQKYLEDMRAGELSAEDFEKVKQEEWRYPKEYTYDDYISDRKSQVLSEESFEEKKKQGKLEIEKIITESNGKIPPEWFWKFLMKTENLVRFLGMNLHWVLFPVFFKSIHKNPQNAWSYMAALCEWWLFTTWAKLWQKLWAFVPHPVLKIPAMIVLWLAWWMWATIFGHKVWEYLDVERHLYLNIPDAEDFTVRALWFKDERSLFWHILSGGIINDFADLIGTDIGIFGTSINFFHTNLDFSVNPRIYLTERKKDITFWNTRLEEFRQKIIPEVREKIAFIKQLYIDKEKVKNAPPDAVFMYGKEETLKQIDKIIAFNKEKLTELLRWQYGDGDMWVVQKHVFTHLQVFLANIDYEKVDATIAENIIHHSINKFAIDQKFYKDFSEKLEGFKWERYSIEAALVGKAKELWLSGKEFEDVMYVNSLDPKRREFITKIFTKLVDPKKPPLLDTSLPNGQKKIYTMYQTIPSEYKKEQVEIHSSASLMGMSSIYYEILSEDQVMWKELMKETKFFTFFKRMLYYKREREFLDNIQKYGTAQKWSWDGLPVESLWTLWWVPLDTIMPTSWPKEA